MLTRMFDLPIEQGLPNFADVGADMYYYDEIATARAGGLILGLDGVHFAPESNITNQDLIVMAYRAMVQRGEAGQGADESVLARYADAYAIADYARPAMAYFTETGVLTGDSLAPETIADRANAAAFIANVLRTRPAH
ncbi:MAG: S-layer homology domain-containing protein [Oscillospiraceae bacterium]|nr:S-layer homology domain-containing protein [Oscillospiraceae bacterium]